MALSQAVWPGLVLPVMDAKKHRYFTALYKGTNRISDYMDADTGEILDLIVSAPLKGPVLLTGPDADMLKMELSDSVSFEDFFVDPAHKKGKGRELLELAEKSSILNPKEVLMGPLYLRRSEAELNLNR
jgi:tRNA threonylcarbamoyladenosine biosynthesis protein TsaB